MADHDAEPAPRFELQSEAQPVQQLELKNENLDELWDNLFKAGEWTDEEAAIVRQALELASALHKDDEYRGQPYLYHCLRIANRIVRYMGIRDPKIVAAALLHDSVEDHAAELIERFEEKPEDDDFRNHVHALNIVNREFNADVMHYVDAVSNLPPAPGEQLTMEQKMEKYVAKIRTATGSFGSWLVKFSDWCENGLGLIHSEFPEGSEQYEYFREKYGGEVLGIYVERFKEYRHLLTPEAANWVSTQLTIGFQRLELGMPHKQSDQLD
jgi:(p)ppGpp synthase/HD superfamily hydrolase